MPTSRVKAKQFVDSVSAHARKERERLGISRDDLDLRIRVEVQDSLIYDEHEDED